MSYDHQKYRPSPLVELPSRQWPNRSISKAPRWCSVDLRDGNQALAQPMGLATKRELLRLLIDLGFKEIELGFPSASQTEFDFVRSVAQDQMLPACVIPQVITQARPALIERTFEALEGFPKAIVHLYNSTSEVQRRIVFRKERREIIELAVSGTEFVKQQAARFPSLNVTYQYSPESFTGTELDFALEICEAVIETWDPQPGHKMIINLPTTVEMTTPNVFADRIEWFIASLKRRGDVVLSVHAHNDRGTGVATAELAQLAGAERIEGTLFGNGERSGNVDIVTLAMNLYSQGIDPELDLSSLAEVTRTIEKCTGIAVHPRHPWAGELVYTAFSGSHQDAIHKGMVARESAPARHWEVPYLPIDPTDVGRRYEEVIRINSQSGKGGMAHVLERDYGYRVPKTLAADFSTAVQEVTDCTGTELTPDVIRELFQKRYTSSGSGPVVRDIGVTGNGSDAMRTVRAEARIRGEWHVMEGKAAGALEAFATALHTVVTGDWDIAHYTQHACGTGASAEAVAYVAVADKRHNRPWFGVASDRDVVRASFSALVIAVDRMIGNRAE